MSFYKFNSCLLTYNFAFLSSVIQFICYIILCKSQESVRNYLPHNSLFLENRLQEIYDEESDSYSSYPLGSVHLEVILHMDKTMAMLEFDSSGKILEKCRLFDLEKESDKLDSSISTAGLPIIRINNIKTMQNVINKCKDLSENLVPKESSEIVLSNFTADASITSLFSLWRGLIPGTKWCGLGDTADSYDDIGPKRDIDLCCRAHDHCPIRLKALRYGYGLINLSLYTKSHCDCDEHFLKCLQKSNNSYSAMLGNFYFNVLKVQCIKEEQTLVCVKVKKTINGNNECVHYNTSLESRMKFATLDFAY